MVIAVEALIDLVLEVGVPAMLDMMPLALSYGFCFTTTGHGRMGLSRGRGSLTHRPQQFRRSGCWSIEPS